VIPTSISSTQVMLNSRPSQPSQAVQLLLKAPLEDTLHTACHKVRPCGWSETHLEVVDLEWFRWDMIRTFWKCGKDFGLVKYDPLNSFDILDQGERHTANLKSLCQGHVPVVNLLLAHKAVPWLPCQLLGWWTFRNNVLRWFGSRKHQQKNILLFAYRIL